MQRGIWGVTRYFLLSTCTITRCHRMHCRAIALDMMIRMQGRGWQVVPAWLLLVMHNHPLTTHRSDDLTGPCSLQLPSYQQACKWRLQRRQATVMVLRAQASSVAERCGPESRRNALCATLPKDRVMLLARRALFRRRFGTTVRSERSACCDADCSLRLLAGGAPVTSTISDCFTNHSAHTGQYCSCTWFMHGMHALAA